MNLWRICTNLIINSRPGHCLLKLFHSSVGDPALPDIDALQARKLGEELKSSVRDARVVVCDQPAELGQLAERFEPGIRHLRMVEFDRLEAKQSAQVFETVIVDRRLGEKSRAI